MKRSPKALWAYFWPNSHAFSDSLPVYKKRWFISEDGNVDLFSYLKIFRE